MLAINLDLIFFTMEYFYLWFGQMWGMCYISNIGGDHPEVYVDKILSLMIKFGNLPPEICRLPRADKDSVIPYYYEDILDYNTATDDDIVYHCKNYSADEPLTFTYYEAIKRITEHGHPESLLKILAKNGSVAVYIQIAEESILTDVQMRRTATQSIEYFLDANSGNPSYTKRYKGLERLVLADVNELFNGTSIFIKDYDIRSSLAVQTTDIETKYHLQRYIKSCVTSEANGHKSSSNEIKLKDTVYLEEDIDALILCETQKKQMSDNHIYDMAFTMEDINSIKNELRSDSHSTERIRKQVQNYMELLKKKHPECTIYKAKVARMLHALEKPIYDGLDIHQPKDYERYTRKNKNNKLINE